MTQANIDLDRVSRFVLHKHHLAAASMATGSNTIDVVRDICGLHAQIASTPYFSLLNRISDFQKDVLTKALYEERTLVKIWGVRATVHIVATDQVAEYYQATKQAGGRHPLKIEPVHNKILKVLNSQGPLTAQELAKHIPELAKMVKTPYGDMSLVALKLHELSQASILLPVKPKGDWKSSLHTYANFKTWLPLVDLQAMDEKLARQKVVIHYLAGYGPATAEDIAWWMGIPKGAVNDVLDAIREQIQEIAITALDGKYIILKQDLEKLRHISSATDSCHLLPKFDPYIMGYSHRQRLIPARHEKKVYRSTRAEVKPVILLNGRIIGTWDQKEQNKKLVINLSLFDKPDKLLANRITQQAERLARFTGAEQPEIHLLSQ
jgi:uncharacterized protein YcaQ